MKPKIRWAGVLLAVVAVVGLLVSRDCWLKVLPFTDPGPPPGRMVDVGGFSLHLVCAGRGGPAVVLESGQADAWLTWFKVQPELARVTQVCSYDRAGVGYSDPGPQPRSRRRMVEELRTLLARAGVPPPYVLVGHSFGGLNVRLYAALHPSEVAGLVLVEAAHEDHWLRAPHEFWERHLDAVKKACRLAEEAERGDAMEPIEDIPELPSLARRQLAAVARRPAWYRATCEEMRIEDKSREELAGLPRGLDLPLVVLSAGDRQRPEWRSAELHARWVRLARRFQSDLASRSHRSRHIEVKSAGHFIHWDRPEVVIREVARLVRTVRR